MNVSQENIGKVNAVIKLEIAKADYAENVEKNLRNYRQKANIPGFRKGMVPMGMVKKMFGKSIEGEELNKLISESLFGYIRDNNLNVLGEPLPSENQPEIDFDTQSEFTFLFDIALAPAVTVNLTKEDKVSYYNIAVTEEMIQKQAESMAMRFGTHEPVEVASEKDMLKGAIVELDEAGNVKVDGIAVESTVVSPAYFKSNEEKAKFAGVKVGAKVIFNPAVSCEGNAAELASMLHVEKEVAGENKSNFEFTVAEITGFKAAEMGQTLFDNVFGEGNVKSEEEYIAKIKEIIVSQLQPESDYKFSLDAREAILNKVGDIELPEAFLKRWMIATGENRTAESIEEEFPKMLPDLKWHLIKEQIVKDLEVKVEEADVKEVAVKTTRAQFAQYGMTNIPEDVIEKYAQDMFKDKEAARRIVDRATEEKITTAIKNAVTLIEQEIAIDDFYKMLEEK